MPEPEEAAPDEKALKNAVMQGDESAWQALYDRHFDRVFSRVHARSGRRRQWTEEVVQDCWMIAVRRIRDFDPCRGTFEGWLWGIAVNVMKNHQRFQKKHMVSADEMPATIEAPVGSCDEINRLEAQELIRLAASELPPRFRMVLAAKYEQQLTVAEISQRLGETPKAIESLLSRARAAFRIAYKRHTNGLE